MKPTHHHATIGPAGNCSPKRRQPNLAFSLIEALAMPALRRLRPPAAALAAASILVLACGHTYRATATDFEWDGGGVDNRWDTQANWNPETNIPTIGDTILLTGASLPGPQTIDLDGIHEIQRIEADGVNGNYTFSGSGFVVFYLAEGNVLLTDELGGSLQIDSDIFFSQTASGTKRFNVTPNGEPIVVNGNITAQGGPAGAFPLELTSRNLSLDPSVVVNGVISDGVSTVGLTAGFETDALAHAGTVEVTGMNTFTGQTLVNGATLKFNSIGNLGGGASALGAPTTIPAGTIRLGAVDTISGPTGPTSGTLLYNGSGHSSDRAFELQGTGGIIEADAGATGGLTLSGGVSATTAGLKTLELGGDSAFSNTYSGAIDDGSGQVEIVKTGSGTWILSATEGNTGDTRIEAGTLRVGVGSTGRLPDASIVTVESGATLRYDINSADAIFGLNGQGNVDLINSDLVLGNTTAAGSAGGVGTFSGTMSGDAGSGLEKRGTGTFTFAGTGTHAGFTEVERGEFVLTGSINGTSNVNVIDGPLTGAGTLTVNGGSLTTPGATTIGLGATLNLEGGSLTAGAGFDNSTGGTLNLNDGTLTVTGGAFAPNAGGPTDDYVIDGPTSSEMPHVIIGAGATTAIGRDLRVGEVERGELTITGGGMVTNDSGFVGFDPVSNGAVTVDGTDGLGNPSTWNNSVLLYVGSSGTGTLDITGGGLVTNGSAGFVGFDPVSNGAVTVDGTDGLGNPSTWNNSSTLLVGFSGTGTLDITGGGLVTNSNGVVGNDPVSNGAVTVDGTDGSGNPSTWNNSSGLSVGQSDTGTLDITGGGLVTNGSIGFVGSGPSSNGAVTVDGTDGLGNPSTWNISSALQVGGSGNGTLDITGGGLVTNALHGNIGRISGSNGTVTVEGTDGSGNPSTWNNSGDLYFGGDAVAAGGTGTLNINAGGLVTVAAELKNWNTGTVNLSGGTLDVATLDLTDAGNTFNMTGGRLVAGTVEGDLDIEGGTLAPGDSPGITNVTGSYTNQTGATVEIEIDSAGGVAGTDFDQVNVTGAANLDGAMFADVGFTPAHQDSFQVMSFGSRTGVFGSVTDAGLTGDFVMAPFYTATDLTLSVELVGDASGNGEVGPEDYTLWADGFGMAEPSYDDGDLSRNGVVGPEDYTIWADNFGLSVSAPSSSPAAVPEPSTVLLAILGVFGVFGVSRRRGSWAR